MTVTLDVFWSSVFALVMASWFAFAAIFIFTKKPPAGPDQKRDRASIFGIALQGLGFAIVWTFHRHFFSPIVYGIDALAKMLGVVAVISAVGSVFLIMKAVRTLGKEWSLTARTVEGHQLATKGPYAYIRHPIYTGMLGMLLATGLAISHWIALLVALIVFFYWYEHQDSH